MAGSFIEIIVTLLLILLNGVFSMSETAFVSARKARLQQRADSGDANAQAALDLMDAPNRFLSTVQIGITLIGELVPKRIALNAPERIATDVVRPMRLLSLLASPLIAFLSLSTETVLRLLRVRPCSEPPVTEEEITNLIEQGRLAGVFEETEQDLVERVLRLGDRRVSALMTARADISWIDIDDSLDQIQQLILQSARTRFPVCQGILDNVLGIVHARDLYVQLASGQLLDLRALIRPALFVPDSTRAFSLLERFKQTGSSIALIVQEYGEIEGVITLTDLLEALVGDLPAADEPVEQEAVQREDGSWLLDGALALQELQDLLVPVVTDSFEWAGWRFEVMDMDGRRVDKVLATPLHPAQSASQQR